MALWRVRATVDDRPGYLSVLTASLALRSVKILAVQVHTTEAGAVDDFLVDTPDTMTEEDLLAAVTRGRGRDAFVARAEAQGLVDQPTRALALAARLVQDPEGLGDALSVLLDAADVTWRATPSVPQPGFAAAGMSLVDPLGGTYEVVRAQPAFTPAEYARAQALVEVAGAALRQQAEHATLLLPDGTELFIRPATEDDADGLRHLHERSSEATRRHRYPMGGADAAEAQLPRLLAPVGGLTLLAGRHDPDTGAEQIVAMANLVAEGDLGEVALLVQDAWQRKGIGTALLRRLVGYAARTGFHAVVANVRSDNTAILRTLRRLGPAGESDRDGAMISVTLPVDRRQQISDDTPTGG
ncbi:MAG TPA: GNAT family N-acetyltransferase [Actinoplanes sp.]|nr:GNAT family N-acetyltransferase [Actinoplanes sp.]